MNLPVALYIHIPWCIKKCPYCDFNSHSVKDELQENAYSRVLIKDLQQDVERFSITEINSIFFGGGTPSLFSVASLDRILTGINQVIPVSDNAEITLEANPGTFDSDKFKGFRTLGINRLSIGIQSFQDKFLNRLGRVHTASEAKNAVEIAQHAGFENINLDLMFGLPDQSMEESSVDVETAISLRPQHISYYQLTLEPNTWFYKHPPVLPEDEKIFQIQQNGIDVLTSHGFTQYEISAFAKSDYQCRHNVNYWKFGDYLGIGAGAHGKISVNCPDQIIRTIKPKHPQEYLQLSFKHQESVIDAKQLALEFLMNNLRLKSGFNLQQFNQYTGMKAEDLEPHISHCIEEKLLVVNNDQIYCTEKGWYFLDSVLQKFLP